MPEDTMVQPGARLDSGPRPMPGSGSWIQRHRGVAIGGGIGVVTLVGYLWYRHSQNAAAAASAGATAPMSSAGSTGSATDTNTSGYSYYPYGGGYGGTMDMSTLASMLNSLEGQVAADSATDAKTTTTTPTPTPTPAAPAPGTAWGAPVPHGKVIGAGYADPVSGYKPIGSAATYQALLKAKTPLFYEPAEGVILPLPPQIEGYIISPHTSYTDTPVFVKG